MSRRLAVLVVCGVLLLATGTASAGGRPDKEWKDWFGHVAIGWSIAESDFGDLFDDDWYFNGGATYWPDMWKVGINLDLAYSQYDAKSSVVRAINEAQEGDGDLTGIDATSWATSANLIWGPDTSGSVGFYLLAGVGIDYTEARAKTDGLVYYPPVCNPWDWWCYPGGVVPGTLIVADKDSWDFSYNLGVGLTFEMNSGSQIYVEAKYHTATTDLADTNYIPVVVGYRW